MAANSDPTPGVEPNRYLVAQGDSGPELAAVVAGSTLDVPDFPKPGIVFKDLTPLFSNGRVLHRVIDGIAAYYRWGDGFDVVAGVEARGFLIAAALAYATGRGVVPVRKAGKLPRAVLSSSYQLEYGEATLEIHEDAFLADQRVLVVDDVLATGGTALAALDLVERAGGTIAGFSVLMELAVLRGRKRIGPSTVHALLTI